jgi:hypothetical protein
MGRWLRGHAGGSSPPGPVRRVIGPARTVLSRRAVGLEQFTCQRRGSARPGCPGARRAGGLSGPPRHVQAIDMKSKHRKTPAFRRPPAGAAARPGRRGIHLHGIAHTAGHHRPASRKLSKDDKNSRHRIPWERRPRRESSNPAIRPGGGPPTSPGSAIQPGGRASHGRGSEGAADAARQGASSSGTSSRRSLRQTRTTRTCFGSRR